ncbi:MAG: GDP-mannose 4,6-dehydratase [Deltaproteobacteria bacterium]|nr:GDP-mannose 4,6-dehydratase [Deltaproteobacteria bacterium]MBK8719495.1 GDP-mannose 4,6-dehydratase [Deltaproteobacteria bacterium]MBP7287546.1 GDP-mannose 4,6-dehydratase [Nannocystaceae bacterium]
MHYAKYLVTGGAGFIGSHLVDRLLESGGTVTVIDDFNDYYDPAFKRANIREHLQHPRYRLVEADIRDQGRIDALVRDTTPECIVHLAARAGVRPSLVDPYLYETTNAGGTLNLLEAARHHGVRKFVFASSSSVYGLNTKVPFAETDALLRPASPYGATKLANEAMCHAYSHLYGLPIVSLRFFTVYGPRQRPDLAIRKFAERMLAGRSIELYGDGSTSRDYTFVDDIIRGVRAAIELDAQGHEVFNLGNSSPVTLAELVTALEQVLGVTAIIERLPEQPGDVPRTFADVTKAEQRLGFAPSTPLGEGLAVFARWLRAGR